MSEDKHPQTSDIDLRLLDIESSRSPRSGLYKTFEIAAYVVGTICVAAGVVVAIWAFWNGIGLVGLGFTLIGVGVALSIYRVQADQSGRESARTQLLMGEIRNHAKTAADNSVETKNIVSELSRARQAAAAASEPAEAVDVPVPVADDDTEEPDEAEPETSDGDGIVRVPGDGEYRYPTAVPLYVISDLVQWWPLPRYSYQRWTLGNLVGAYRRFNNDGKLTGVPWIVTFRRSNGDLVEYRVSYAGKAQGASISVFSSERDRWQELTAPSEKASSADLGS